MTTTAKVTHTPGPWTIEQPGHLSLATRVIESDSGRVAMVRHQEDADLISAAPDMLEALEAFVALNLSAAPGSPVGQARAKAKAAIAKAKGGAA